MQIERIETERIVPEVLGPFEQAAAAMGSERFYRAFSAGLEAGVRVDRLYLIDGSARTEPLIAETESGKPPVSGPAYVTRFLPSDPLQAAIDRIDGDGTILRLRVLPSDILVPAYRRMLERAEVIERVSFLRKLGRDGWRCLTVARRRQSGGFDARELDWLGGYFRLVTPLIDRHRALVGEVVEDRAERILELEERFARHCPQLTPRERQICARAAMGISVEGAALDLGIAASSVLTYRKRAYHRLGVSSAYELARLVLR
ncbi:MAG: helix-turn-helix transcriptional regulator [Novosphingobium sp.]|nr:helix-turn-helix transcriptional regulator [Novosphingobium sp.]